MKEPNHIKVSSNLTIPLETIGIITWIVFMILDYGCGVEWLQNQQPCAHFWTWFPLWAPIALGVAFFLIGMIVIFLIVLIANALDK